MIKKENESKNEHDMFCVLVNSNLMLENVIQIKRGTRLNANVIVKN